MKNSQVLLVLSSAVLMSVSLASANPQTQNGDKKTPCPAPQPGVRAAFNIIESNPGSSLAAYLRANVIAKTAKNEKCETLYLTAIRTKNEKARRDLESIGYGPKNAKEVNEYIIKQEDGLYEFKIMNTFEFAVAYGSYKAISELRARGGEISENSREIGNTELLFASYSNSKPVLEQLIQAGADVNEVGYDTRSALSYAALNNSAEAVEILVRAGADITYSDRGGRTALHFASWRQKKDNKEIVQLLVGAGSDVNHRAGDGSTPLLIAAGGNDEIEIVDFLIKAGADVSLSDYSGNNALMLAAQNAKGKKLVEYFLLKGLSANLKNKYDVTALMFAAAKSDAASVDLLLKAGARVNDVDDRNRSALIYLVKFQTALVKEKANLLIAAGADKSIKAYGQTAYDIAKEKKLSQEILNLLKP